VIYIFFTSEGLDYFSKNAFIILDKLTRYSYVFVLGE